MRKCIDRVSGISTIAITILTVPFLFAARVTQTPGPQAVPPTEVSTLRLPGLRERVTIRRDGRGIPYIEAASTADLFCAQGFVTASDRLWQMDLLRRAARGELAEIFGRAALEEDKRHRRFGFVRVSELQAEHAQAEAKTDMESYARGVNAWIDSRDEKNLPAEFRLLKYRPRPWSPADTLLVAKLLAEDLSTSWRKDLMRSALSDLPPGKLAMLLPESSPRDVTLVGRDDPKSGERPPAAPPADRGYSPPGIAKEELYALLAHDAEIERRALERVGLYSENLAASNNWVVSGKHTVSGKPLLANDPHLAPSVPSIWYMIHLHAPGLHAAGVTFPGTPGVVLGHNQKIAWGATNLGPDVQDLYLERFDPENPRRYKTPAGWAEAETRREEIKVRKSPTDSSTESVTLEVTVTRHGPIVFEKGEGSDRLRYALRWTMLDPQFDPFSTFVRFDRARNWKEFCEALRSYPGPAQNFIYADQEGHIGYYGAGRVPVRKTGDGSIPYDGSTEDGEWVGYIPFESLPHVFDPADGIIATANNRVVGKDYAYHLTREWADPYRARRIHDLLSAKPRLSSDDMRAIQADLFSIAGSAFAAELLRMTRDSAAGRENALEWKNLPDLLAHWDGRMSPESEAALAVSEILGIFRNRILAAALGTERAKDYRWFSEGTFLEQVIREKPRDWLPARFADYPALLCSCWLEARTNLAQRFGADESGWVWGKTATISRWWKHPMAGAPFVGAQFQIPTFPTAGSGGNLATVNVGTPVSMRMIVDLSDWDKTLHGIALGESGDPSSAHYKDQLEDWKNVAPRVFPFTPAAVLAMSSQIVILGP